MESMSFLHVDGLVHAVQLGVSGSGSISPKGCEMSEKNEKSVNRFRQKNSISVFSPKNVELSENESDWQWADTFRVHLGDRPV